MAGLWFRGYKGCISVPLDFSAIGKAAILNPIGSTFGTEQHPQFRE